MWNDGRTIPGTPLASAVIVRVKAAPSWTGACGGTGSQVSRTFRAVVVTMVASPSAPGGILAANETAVVATRWATEGLP